MRRLDPVLHSPPRIAIVSRLLVAGPMRFSTLRDALNMTGGTLATHVDTLEKAGYVSQRTGIVALRPAKVIDATRSGRDAFFQYLTELEEHLDELRRAVGKK